MNDDYDYDEYVDDENYADENEDGFDDDDEEEEGCRAQMLTKLVAIARQDARIQQASDIYDQGENDIIRLKIYSP